MTMNLSVYFGKAVLQETRISKMKVSDIPTEMMSISAITAANAKGESFN